MGHDKIPVLIIGPVAPPIGGMTVATENILLSDLKNKYDLVMLDVTGMRARGRGSFVGGSFYQAYLLIRLFSILIKHRPRIVHVAMASFFYFYRRSIDIIICKLCGRKVVFHLHGARFIEFYEKSPALGKKYIAFMLNVSDRIIALSGGWRDFLATIARKDKIAVIPNGVDGSSFRMAHDKKSELGFSQDHIVAAYISPVSGRKGVFDIIKAIPKILEKIKNITFLFCGPEETDGELEKFRKAVSDAGLGKSVIYAGIVQGQQKTDHYMSSDIFLLPSYAENLPVALLEAMAAGLPVVVSDVGAIPEIIKDGENGFLIKAGNVEAIAEKIVCLAKDKEARMAMGRRNRELIRLKYDMPVIASEIDTLYRELS